MNQLMKNDPKQTLQFLGPNTLNRNGPSYSRPPFFWFQNRIIFVPSTDRKNSGCWCARNQSALTAVVDEPGLPSMTSRPS